MTLAQPSERAAAPQPVLVGFLELLGVATVVFGLYTSPLQTWAASSLDILTAIPRSGS